MMVTVSLRRLPTQLLGSKQRILRISLPACFSSSCVSPGALPTYLINQSKHLCSGDVDPPLSLNLPRLYSMKWCPYAQRSRLALAHKQVRHEEVNINLSDKPSWLLDKNPEGTVPILEIYSGQSDSSLTRIIGSMEICEWLEEEYPSTPALFSSKIESPLHTDILSQFKLVSPIMNDYIYGRLGDDLQSPIQTREVVLSSLHTLEKLLHQDNKYLLGDSVAITDFLLWPLFERSLAKGLVLDSLSKLSGWVERMSILSAVKDVRNSRKGYELYWKSQRSGSTNYDIDV